MTRKKDKKMTEMIKKWDGRLKNIEYVIGNSFDDCYLDYYSTYTEAAKSYNARQRAYRADYADSIRNNDSSYSYMEDEAPIYIVARRGETEISLIELEEMLKIATIDDYSDYHKPFALHNGKTGKWAYGLKQTPDGYATFGEANSQHEAVHLADMVLQEKRESERQYYTDLLGIDQQIASKKLDQELIK